MIWLRRLIGRGRLERQLEAELRDHIERSVADAVDHGVPEQEARRRARLTFGGVDQIKEQCRDTRGTRWLHEIAQDARYGARLLWRAPAFTLVATLSLGLGIGANTAIFSLVESLLLRSLPVREPEQLVLVQGDSWTNPIWEAIRDRQQSVAGAALAWSDDRFDLARGGEADLVNGLWVSGSLFDVLGVNATIGRTLNMADDRRGGGPDGPVVVVSHRFWQRRFAGASDVIGRTITINRVPFTIVGVSAPRFLGPTVGRAFDVAAPIGTVDFVRRGQESWLDGRSTWWLEVMLRLKPGQTIGDATTALRRVQAEIREATLPANWPTDARDGYLSDPLTLVAASKGFSWLRGYYREPLLMLMGIVALVLLIACANVVSLLLARATARRHEMSARLALGASRGRLARQLATESVVLVVPGALAGLALAYWAGDVLIDLISTPERPVSLDLSLRWPVLTFTAVVASATALVFGIAPALRVARAAPQHALAEHSRAQVGEGRRPLGSALVVGQMALSLVLVVGAGLFVRTFSSLAGLDLGFDADRVLMVRVDAPAGAKELPARLALYERLREAAAAVPGVAHASLSAIPPMSGMGWNEQFEFPDQPRLSGRDRYVWLNAISPGWLTTYGTDLTAGRDFDARDRAGSPAVAIVNEAFVREYLNGKLAIGRTIRRAGHPGRPPLDLQIVGVAENAAYRSAREPLPATVYLPLAQVAGDDLPPGVGLSVRAASGSPARLVRSLGAAIEHVDPTLSLTFRQLGTQVEATLSQERLIATLSAFFGALALLLAAVGLYGVTAYAVTRRRTEIGIRMALGADATRVVRLVVGRAALLVGLGVAIGGTLSLWASRFVATMLFGVQPRDPATFVGAAFVLATIAALATWLPARRAARIDPARVLREG